MDVEISKTPVFSLQEARPFFLVLFVAIFLALGKIIFRRICKAQFVSVGFLAVAGVPSASFADHVSTNLKAE